MKQSEIKVGATYLFVATDDPLRQHLAGKPFHVTGTRQDMRKMHGRRKPPRLKFLNGNGVYARAEELEPLKDDLPF